MGTRLTPVAVDIETTGFAADDEVTVVGFSLPLGCRVFLQTDGRAVDRPALVGDLEAAFDTSIRLSAHPDEGALLGAFSEFVDSRLGGNDYLLTAFNGEVFNGGFDIPFLRTRFVVSDEPWPFADLPYADLMPIFRNRFNTTLGESSVADLVGVYDTLVGGDLTKSDPFADSVEAVEAFGDGEFGPLVSHNVADVLRTDALASIAQRYCAKSEFQLKSLTATVDDPTLTS